MLRSDHLFELVQSLDASERRYLLGKGRKSDGKDTGYSKLIKVMVGMNEYSEADLKQALREFSISGKTDVKKHYLYQWILKHLYDYHSSRYPDHQLLRNIRVLTDRSLVHQAKVLIPSIKSRLIESEKYTDLLMLLEIELHNSRYDDDADPLQIAEELNQYSKRYAELRTLEGLRYRIRGILNQNIFSRSDSARKKINELFRTPAVRTRPDKGSFLMNFNYNLLFYWKFGSDDNWNSAFSYAKENFKLLERHPKIINYYPEAVLQIAYAFISAAAILNDPLYKKGIQYLKKIEMTRQSRRMRYDIRFHIHLSELIHYNRNRPAVTDHRFIREAEIFIEENKADFTDIRINNYYFDLAKSLFYIRDFKAAFRVINEVYQIHYVKDRSVDFHTHSRLLYCLICKELGETDLMISTAKALSGFMKRKAIFYIFEQRILRFIISELPTLHDKSGHTKATVFNKLKKDVLHIFKSEHEKKVLNYFDYAYWIESELERIKP